MAEDNSQKDIAAKAVADKLNGKKTDTPGDGGDNSDTKTEEEHKKELTAQFKEANSDKSDDDIATLVNDKLTEEKTNKDNLAKKLTEIKDRPENKDKSDDDIKAILKEELLKPPAKKNTNTDTPPEKPKTLNELIKDATKGTFADIDTLLNKANESKGDVFANDQIKHLNELATKGVDLADIFRYQSLDIDKLDPSDLEQAKELIKHELRFTHPGITEKELEYEMKFNYQLELKSETYDDDGEEKTRVTNTDEVEASKLKLMRNARVAKENLIVKQKEAELPKANGGMSQKDKDELQTKWGAKVEDNLKDVTKVDFKIGNKGEETFTYEIENIEKLKNTMSEPDRFLSRYKKPDGQTDMAKFQQDMLAVSEMDNIVKSAFEQGTSVGYENAINGISNLSTESDGGGAQSDHTPTTPAKAVSKKFAKEVGGY